MTAFGGFPAETIRFLRELRAATTARTGSTPTGPITRRSGSRRPRRSWSPPANCWPSSPPGSGPSPGCWARSCASTATPVQPRPQPLQGPPRLLVLGRRAAPRRERLLRPAHPGVPWRRGRLPWAGSRAAGPVPPGRRRPGQRRGTGRHRPAPGGGRLPAGRGHPQAAAGGLRPRWPRCTDGSPTTSRRPEPGYFGRQRAGVGRAPVDPAAQVLASHATGHVSVQQEGKRAEHLPLGQSRPVAEHLPNPDGATSYCP
jgi:hypothetical protein